MARGHSSKGHNAHPVATLFWTCVKIAQALQDFHGEEGRLIWMPPIDVIYNTIWIH